MTYFLSPNGDPLPTDWVGWLRSFETGEKRPAAMEDMYAIRVAICRLRKKNYFFRTVKKDAVEGEVERISKMEWIHEPKRGVGRKKNLGRKKKRKRSAQRKI